MHGKIKIGLFISLYKTQRLIGRNILKSIKEAIRNFNYFLNLGENLKKEIEFMAKIEGE